MTAVLCNYCSPAPTNPQCPVSTSRHTRPPSLPALLPRPAAPHRQNSSEHPEIIVSSHETTTLICPTQHRKLRRRQLDTTVAGSPLNQNHFFTYTWPGRYFVQSLLSTCFSTTPVYWQRRRTDHATTDFRKNTPTAVIIFDSCNPLQWWAKGTHVGPGGGRQLRPTTTTMQSPHKKIRNMFWFPLSPLYQHAGHRLCGIHVPYNLCAREASQDAGPLTKIIFSPFVFGFMSPARFPGNPARTHHEWYGVSPPAGRESMRQNYVLFRICHVPKIVLFRICHATKLCFISHLPCAKVIIFIRNYHITTVMSFLLLLFINCNVKYYPYNTNLIYPRDYPNTTLIFFLYYFPL